MNLKQLPYFIAIAQTGSLSAAARQAGVSQPAVSAYLQELERDLETRMFTREGGRLRPTAAGQIYLNMARQVLSIQEQARLQIYPQAREEKQVIRVGISPHRGAQALATIYLEFSKEYPNIQLQPVERYANDSLDLLVKGELELSFTTVSGEETAPGLEILPLQREEIVLAIPAFHRLAFFGDRDVTRAPRLNLEEFRDSPFVLMSPGSTAGRVSRQLFSRCGLDPVTVFQTGNVIMVRDMIRSGAGVGLIPSYYAQPTEEVTYFRLKDPGYIVFSAVWKESRELTRPERYILYLKEKLYDSKYASPLSQMIHPPEFTRMVEEFQEVLL